MTHKLRSILLTTLKIPFYFFLTLSLLMILSTLISKTKPSAGLGFLVMASIFGAPYIIIKYFSEGQKENPNNQSQNKINCPTCGATIKKELPKKGDIKCPYCDSHFS